jgi:hypothetical protein
MMTTTTSAMDDEISHNEANAVANETNDTARGPVQAQVTDAPHGDALKTDDVIELQAFLEVGWHHTSVL